LIYVLWKPRTARGVFGVVKMEVNISGRMYVKSPKRTFILNITKELEEYLKDNPDLLRDLTLKALERRIQEVQKEIEEAKKGQEEVRTLAEAIEETLKTKKKWSGFPKETRRKYRRALRKLLAEIMSWDELYEYNLKENYERLHELLALKDTIEQLEPIFLEVSEDG